MKKTTVLLSLALLVGFGVLLAFAGPNAGSANYVQPVQIQVPHASIPAPAGYWVYTNSTMIAPPRNLESAKPWVVTGLYRNGDVIMSAEKFYWNCALVYTPSPVTVAPTHTGGDVTDGSNTWRRVIMNPRQGMDVVNATTNEVWLAFGVGTAAVVNSGTLLTTTGSSWDPGDIYFQEAVYAVTSSTMSNRVVVSER